jgi:diguanylate cyclase (GGDEF)-like protein
MGRAHRDDSQFAVLFIDLDGFKAVNDSLGHEAGDKVLQEATKSFLLCIRESDKVARIGGDEFVVLTERTTPQLAAKIAERIIAQIKVPISLACGEANIGASIGIAIYPKNGTSLDAMMKAADDAMYRVKRSTKGAVAMAE